MKKKFLSLSVLTMMTLNTINVYANEIIKPETNTKLAEFAELVSNYADILIAFALSTSVLIFIIHFIRLANSFDHPFMRRQVQRDIFITGIVTALIGGITIVVKVISSTVL